MATIYVFIYFSGIKVVILGSFQFEKNLSFKRHFGKEMVCIFHLYKEIFKGNLVFKINAFKRFLTQGKLEK